MWVEYLVEENISREERYVPVDGLIPVTVAIDNQQLWILKFRAARQVDDCLRAARVLACVLFVLERICLVDVEFPLGWLCYVFLWTMSPRSITIDMLCSFWLHVQSCPFRPHLYSVQFIKTQKH